ncbi:MAG: DUF2318 domain-containing protein [Deltaproteobacteria bacterium]|nr:MAG: DUF2318 domain-containing protein [Deltaproteobacteria bacterium]
MAKKKRPSSTEKRAAKKAAVLETKRKKKSSLANLVVVLLLVGGGLIFYLLQTGFEFAPKTSAVKPTVSATEVSFPVQGFNDGQARHFQFPTGNNITVRFFILKSSDGIVRAAYDACDVCWREGKGYYQDGDFMVCRNCGQRFASVKVNEIKGGCNPAPLDRQVVGDKLVIKIADILKGSRYFESTKES